MVNTTKKYKVVGVEPEVILDGPQEMMQYVIDNTTTGQSIQFVEIVIYTNEGGGQ